MRRVRKRVEIFIRAAEYCSQPFTDDYIFNYRNVSTRLGRKEETKLGNVNVNKISLYPIPKLSK